MANHRILLFDGNILSGFLKQRLTYVIYSINAEDENFLLNVNEADYILHKSSEAHVEPLQIDLKDIYASNHETILDAWKFPNYKDVIERTKMIIKIHVPFSGNPYLLTCEPSSHTVSWSLDIELLTEEFCFEIPNLYDDSNQLVKEKDAIIHRIVAKMNQINVEVAQYNGFIETKLRKAFIDRKERILTNKKILVSLGVPLKKADNIPATFAVPTPKMREKIIISKPIVKDTKFNPEPTLDLKVYNQILQVIHDVGKQFERLPSTYKDKKEEDIRDHFLLFLEPNFEGSATGETFNKTGKTDILLRHENTNVFIGECKFWDGEKKFLETITQLLRYLTWRDSKASVIFFVRNKDFSSVIATVEKATGLHPNHIEFNGKKDETWLNYTFHLIDDRNRLVKLAILLYHIPL